MPCLANGAIANYAFVHTFIFYCCADANGDIGPFQVAIGLTLVCLVLVLFWEENTGMTDQAPSKQQQQQQDPLSSSSLLDAAQRSVQVIASSPAVLLLGLSQAFYEGAVFTFGEKSYVSRSKRSLRG